MVTTELLVQLGLLVGIIVAVPLLLWVFFVLWMMTGVGGWEPTTASDRWWVRLFAASAILVGIIIVGLPIAAFVILSNILGLSTAFTVVLLLGVAIYVFNAIWNSPAF